LPLPALRIPRVVGVDDVALKRRHTVGEDHRLCSSARFGSRSLVRHLEQFGQ
jgi:hypothetical protein